MTNATPRVKPDAGNPHVRFDEGEVAPENPGRGSQLYNRREFIGSAIACATAGCVTNRPDSGLGRRWYKGMLHCHSYWSDGHAFPEQAVSAYRKLGYDFMSLTDHNCLSMTDGRWCPIFEKAGGWPPKATYRYLENARRRFPWIRTRTTADGRTEAMLTPYGELMRRFNDPGRFLLMPGCEITRYLGNPGDQNGLHLHMNYVGLDEVIPSARHAGLVQTIVSHRSPSTLIRATREETELLAAAKGNPPHFFSVNHPHWRYYDVLPQDLIDNPEVRFFEVCNNCAEQDEIAELRDCNGYDNDRFWDVVNAFRARAGQPLLYGTAVDDAHWYPFSGATTPESCEECYAGNGYIRVHADALTPAALFTAMEQGEFYAANGLDLEDVAFDGKTLRVRVPAHAGVVCHVKFIVTKRGFDDRVVKTVELAKSETNRYARKIPLHSSEIGRVVQEVVGERGQAIDASYALRPDDLYVRARVESDRLSPFATWHRKLPKYATHPIYATAWTQPCVRQ